MSWETWGVFFLTETVLALSPGPAVLFVVSTALRHGGRTSVWANLGILSGNTFYFLLSALGLGAVLLASHELFTVVKWVGAAYLVYLGLRLIISPGGSEIGDSQDSSGAPEAGRARKVFRQAFILQAANPKAIMFFVALLPQFINPNENIALQVAVLALTSVTSEFVVLVGYGFAAGRLSHWAKRPGVTRTADRAAGTLLVGAGIGLGLTANR